MTKSIAAGIPLMYTGQDRYECPACGRNDFTIMQTDQGYVYRCYHASCILHDSQFVPSNGRIEFEPDVKVRTSKHKVFDWETRSLTASEAAWLMKFYHFDANDILRAGIKYAPKQQRYILPVRDRLGVTTGVVARTITDNGAKALTFKLRDVKLVHWSYPYVPMARTPVVIVEDIYSAMRVSRIDRTGMALLGTSISDEAIKQLTAGMPTQVIVALDKDATQKAYEMAWELRTLFPKARVAKLEQDIKNLPDDQAVRQVLGI